MTTEPLNIEMLRQLDSDVRELRAALQELHNSQDRHAATMERRLAGVESTFALHKATGNGETQAGPLGRLRQWKDVIIIALIAKLAGLNVAQIMGWIGD